MGSLRKCKGGVIVTIKERRTSKKTQQMRKEMPERKAYPSDLTDAQWEVLEPLIPAVAEDATNVAYSRREIVNGILYVLRSGCPWRWVPHDLPAWGTVYWYFRTWRNEGVWDQILHTLRQQVRYKQGREPEPSAAVIDSQSIKTSAVRGPEKGFDMGKKSGDANAISSSIRRATSWQSKSREPMPLITREPGACLSQRKISLAGSLCCGEIAIMGAHSSHGLRSIWVGRSRSCGD